MLTLFGYDPNQWNEWRLLWSSPWSGVSLVLVVLALLVSLGLGYWGIRQASRRRKVFLLGFRALALLGVFVLFLMPSLELSQVTRARSDVVVLLDKSASMALPGSIGGPTRETLLREFLENNKGLWEGILEEHSLNVLSFGSALNAASLSEPPTPNESATHIREAISEVLAQYQDKDLGGVLIFSDGADNGGFSAIGPNGIINDELLRSLQKKEIPIHTFFTGVHGSLRDLSIASVNVGEFAFIHNATEVEVSLSVSGLNEISSTTVTLSKGGKPISSKEVLLNQNQEAKVTFRLVPEELGKFIYTIETPVYNGEAVKENNRADFVLQVIRDKIRVLQIVGRPNWDERYLRGLLKDDPNVDLISFFILRGPDDLQPLPNSELSLIPFPQEELFGSELPSFDVVIFQNFDYEPYGVGPYLDKVKEYVEGGGGLIMLGGDLSFTQGGYRDTPVEEVLPFVLSEQRFTESGEDALWVPGEFHAKLTEQGKRHPVSAFFDSPERASERWKALPFEGLNKVERVKPGATVLAVHPTERLGADPAPLLAAQEFGKGRSLALLTDSLWQWAFSAREQGDTGDSFREFWRRAVRWLIKDPELKPLRILSDKDRYDVGEEVKLQVRAYTADYQPAQGIKVSLSLSAADGKEEKEELTTNEDGEAWYTYQPKNPGAYLATAKATLQDKEFTEDTAFIITQKGDELRAVRPRADLLQALAEATGGTFFPLPQSLDEDDAESLSLKPPRVVRVDRRKEEPLWSSAPFLLLPSLLLCIEWFFRRRWGYR